MDAFLEAAKKKAKLGIRKKAKPDVGKEGTPKKKAPKKIRVAAAPEALVPGTIYIGHLPHGFYEDQLKKYFSQFGNILKMRVARSRKTGNCKGYAFIQFEVEEVAKIAAETMNNYMFFEKLLKCEFVPSEKMNSNTFRGWKRHMLFSHIKNKIKQNSKKSEKVIDKNTKRRIQRLQKLKATLKDKGVLFKFKPATLKPENV